MRKVDIVNLNLPWEYFPFSCPYCDEYFKTAGEKVRQLAREYEYEILDTRIQPNG